MRASLHVSRLGQGTRIIWVDYQTDLNRITAARKHNRDGPRHRLSGESRDAAACCRYNVHATSNQLGCQCWQSFILAIRPAVFDRDILAIDVAAFDKTLAERCDCVACLAWRATAEESDDGYCW